MNHIARQRLIRTPIRGISGDLSTHIIPPSHGTSQLVAMHTLDTQPIYMERQGLNTLDRCCRVAITRRER